MNKLGLIAGNRNFPLLFATCAKSKDPSLEIIAVAIKGETSKNLSRLVDKIYWLKIGGLRALCDVFLKEGVKTLVMAGQISPYRIFKDRQDWDSLMQKVFKSTPDFRPHSIFTEIIREIESQGFSFISSLTYLEDYLAKDGLNNKADVSESLEKEIEHALSLARKTADLDIGQTVVIKDKAVVAVEALEGTDKTIHRAFGICGQGFIVLKLAKKNQDLRFDVPVIGLNTIKQLVRFKAKALVLEKNKTLILDKPEVISLADKAGLPIVGV